MDRQYIDDHHVVARYLADQLSEAEREQFEGYYLEHPELVQEMEAAARFKAGLLQLSDRGELGELLRPEPWYRSTRWLVVAAAAGTLAVGIAYVVAHRPGAQPLLVADAEALQTWRGQPFAIAGSYEILRLRAGADDAQLAAAASGQAIELTVLPEFAAAGYRVALARLAPDDSLRVLADIADLESGADGFVHVFLNAARLEPGRYRLTISGDSDTGGGSEVSAFMIRVVEPSAQQPQRR